MDYEKHYRLLIETRSCRELPENVYYEKHHIIPESMGGSNDPSNIIRLTAREHFIAHWLLWRIHGTKQMAFAFYAMVNMGKNQSVKSSRIYEEAKMARRTFIIENNKKYHKGKKLSDKEVARVTELFKNMIRTEEHRKNISKSLTGKSKSESHRKKLSESLSGYDWSSYKERNGKIALKNSGKNNGMAKSVIMFNSEYQFLREFDTAEDARNFFNENNDSDLSKTTFWRRIISEKELKGYRFKFSS
jgi:hypothetical protein